jgi:hypothetical protein
MISLNMGMGMFFVQLQFLYNSWSEMETHFHFWLQMWILIRYVLWYYM